MSETANIPAQINSSEAEYTFVVAGAVLSCSYGSNPNRLTTPFSHGVYIKNKAQLNIMDFQSLKNIRPFGICNKPGCTPVPCVPACTLPWINGKADKLIEQQPALLNISTNMCLSGGRITIEDDGQ